MGRTGTAIEPAPVPVAAPAALPATSPPRARHGRPCHDALMSTAHLAEQIAHVEQQEHDLLFRRFTHDDAWQLGCMLVELATERALPVTIDVRRGRQQVFHAARPGTVPDNDRWIERKVRVVERFDASSYLVGLRLHHAGTSLKKFGLPAQEYAAAGGAFPVRIEDAGLVGVVTVSGLSQADDHALVVEAIRAFLA
ncbi:UPF0303 protein [Cellulomonas soli]|uniref:UPF0303 protein CSO01_08840 n=2 Tax=Cellulomonas soli TaxID=931535 RepID=A0A512PAC5_9CELL|nr:UPF0303 protein [Cellulomonas soli]